jgi:hypothetical protein
LPLNITKCDAPGRMLGPGDRLDSRTVPIAFSLITSHAGRCQARVRRQRDEKSRLRRYLMPVEPCARNRCRLPCRNPGAVSTRPRAIRFGGKTAIGCAVSARPPLCGTIRRAPNGQAIEIVRAKRQARFDAVTSQLPYTVSRISRASSFRQSTFR